MAMFVTRHPTRFPFAASLAALCLISCVEVRAEKLRSVFGGIANNGGLGYVSPTFQLGAQVEQRWASWELNVKFDVSTSRKLNFDEGWSATTGAGGTWFFSRPVFLTGGVRFGYTRTSEYDKWALHPYLGAGLDFPLGSQEWRVSAAYVHRGTDTANDLHGLDFAARYRQAAQGWFVVAYGGAWEFISGGRSYSRSNYGLNVGKEF